jgi:hypothetical protein
MSRADAPSCPRIELLQPLQHSELIRPLSAQFGFELFVRDDAFGDHVTGYW